MAIQISPLFNPQVLGTAAATIFTVPAAPASLTLARGRVRFTNTSGAAVSVTAYAIPLGGTAGPGTAYLNAESIAQNTHLDVDLPVLGPGGFLQALASAVTSITVHLLDGVLFS
jgi:hypothetical protein